ncbi:unnamed protein product [Leptidea sinapis]|uniref:Endonuclease/exonuclease/phosphatase domain-containing protein n=1 Tax=Leptidea sinapis TaxID=189913 RepID=A0A5E4Q718_9NEOP|nr:unnamed protein product [Leptidea sinapis]
MVALIEEESVEAVYVLGDFHAHPGTRFGGELQSFWTVIRLQIWYLCVDIELLPTNTHTYASEAHGSRRWLDHCVATSAARDTVRTVHVEYGVYWSDHLPVVITCEMTAIISKVNLTDTDSLRGIKWGHRRDAQIDVYNKYCCDNLRLPNIYF